LSDQAEVGFMAGETLRVRYQRGDAVIELEGDAESVLAELASLRADGFGMLMEFFGLLAPTVSSALTGGRPPVGRPESLVQCSRKRRRCQRRTVSGGHDHEGLPPPGPDPRQPDPEETISRAKLGPGHRSPVHGELLAQGEVLEGELPVAAAEEREESKHVEQEGYHRTEILSGSDLTDQRLGPGRGFGEGQRRGSNQVTSTRLV
jgi:hypothetical protein